MKLFTYLFLLFVIMEGIYCKPFWNSRPKDTEVRYERHHRVRVLGMTFDTQKRVSGNNTPVARIIGWFVPRDTKIWREKDFHIGIPQLFEIRGHKGYGVENY